MTNDASSSGASLHPRRGRTTLRGSSVGWFVVGVLTTATVAVVSGSQWSSAAEPADDATLVPITPCRLADTRPAPDRVGPNASLGVDDTTTIVARGSNGQCTIPDDAVALLLNVTAVGATEVGTFITIWPGGERPTASSLNPAAGQPPTPNAVTTRLSASGSFDVYNQAGSVDVVIDVNGYYSESSLDDLSTALDAAESELSQLRAEVDALRDGTSTLASGATLTGFEWISEVIVADDTARSSLFSLPPPVLALPIPVPIRFAPESGPDDLVIDTAEDARCGAAGAVLEPEPGLMCLYLEAATNVDGIGLSGVGFVGENFVTFVHDGLQGDGAAFGYRWAFTAP